MLASCFNNIIEQCLYQCKMPHLSYTEFLHKTETVSGTNKCLKNAFVDQIAHGLVTKGTLGVLTVLNYLSNCLSFSFKEIKSEKRKQQIISLLLLAF